MRACSQLLGGPLSVNLAVFIPKQELLRCALLTTRGYVLIEVHANLACLLVLADLEDGLIPLPDDQLLLPRPLDLPVNHAHHVMHTLTVWGRI